MIGNGSWTTRSNALTLFRDGSLRLPSLTGTGTTLLSADAQGTIVRMTSPATVAGLGITDAVTKDSSGNVGITGRLTVGEESAAIGWASTAMGDSATASGEASTSMGASTNASNWASTAMGGNTTASGYASTAMGYLTIASEWGSTAMGDHTTASGNASTAMGKSTTASGESSTTLGDMTTASGDYSTALGAETTASGFYSTAMGNGTTASGTSSTAMGYVTTANSFGMTAIGSRNIIRPENTPDDWVPTDDLFVIGNGMYAPSNAFSVKKNGETYIQGNLGIGTSTIPTAKLEVAGDAKITGTLTVGGQSVVTATQVAAGYQPLDSDLTALAALTTTAFGRGLLDDADAAAARATLGLGGAATAAFGTAAGTVAAGNDSRITSAVPKTRTISTNAPLTGGGALTGNLTLGISVATTTTNGAMSAADKTKLQGIATGATANFPDATLLARANHTGTQDWATTISGKPTTTTGYGITDAVTKTATGDVTVTGATTLQGATSVTAPLTINAPVTFVNSNPAHRVTGLRVEPAGDIPMLTP